MPDESAKAACINNRSNQLGAAAACSSSHHGKRGGDGKSRHVGIANFNSGRVGFSSCKPPPRLLVEHWFQRIKALPNQIRAVRHASRLRGAIPAVNLPVKLSVAP